MNEHFPTFHTEQKVEHPENVDSKFGESAALIEMMERLPAHVIGSARDLLKTNPYTNQVDVVKFGANANDTSVVSFDSTVDGTVYGIFKPGSGENAIAKEEMGFRPEQLLYPRERAAYDVSRHFGFDVVPPTTIREINGQLGSVQLLLDPAQYLTLPQFIQDRLHSSIEDEWLNLLAANSDTDTIALFDYVVGGMDRHMHNIMIQGGSDIKEDDFHDNLNLAAIDNGYSFNSLAFERAEFLYGPLVMRTTADTPEDPHQHYSCDRGGRNIQYRKAQDIPDELLAKLKDGYHRRESLMTDSLITMIGRQQLEALWQRVEDLTKNRVFISPINSEHAMGY